MQVVVIDPRTGDEDTYFVRDPVTAKVARRIAKNRYAVTRGVDAERLRTRLA